MNLYQTTHKMQKVVVASIEGLPADEVVAKHYLADRNSFNATAKHWAQAYAQAPASKKTSVPGKVATDAEMAGLSEESVTGFTDMGFPRDKVVSCGD